MERDRDTARDRAAAFEDELSRERDASRASLADVRSELDAVRVAHAALNSEAAKLRGVRGLVDTIFFNFFFLFSWVIICKSLNNSKLTPPVLTYPPVPLRASLRLSMKPRAAPASGRAAGAWPTRNATSGKIRCADSVFFFFFFFFLGIVCLLSINRPVPH
jgi:hypothetical protein